MLTQVDHLFEEDFYIFLPFRDVILNQPLALLISSLDFGEITVQFTSCLTGLDTVALIPFNKNYIR